MYLHVVIFYMVKWVSCDDGIRAAISKRCWVKDPWRSLSYVVSDVVVVFALAAAAAYRWYWPLYLAAQGTMFWAPFALGDDCGHGSFSNNPKLNSVVCHLLHSSILVPYQGRGVEVLERVVLTLIHQRFVCPKGEERCNNLHRLLDDNGWFACGIIFCYLQSLAFRELSEASLICSLLAGKVPRNGFAFCNVHGEIYLV